MEENQKQGSGVGEETRGEAQHTSNYLEAFRLSQADWRMWGEKETSSTQLLCSRDSESDTDDLSTLDYGSHGSDLNEILDMELDGVDCNYSAGGGDMGNEVEVKMLVNEGGHDQQPQSETGSAENSGREFLTKLD